MLERIYRSWLQQGLHAMLANGCPRCAGRISFRGEAVNCLTCGWELLADGIGRTKAAVA